MSLMPEVVSPLEAMEENPRRWVGRWRAIGVPLPLRR